DDLIFGRAHDEMHRHAERIFHVTLGTPDAVRPAWALHAREPRFRRVRKTLRIRQLDFLGRSTDRHKQTFKMPGVSVNAGLIPRGANPEGRCPSFCAHRSSAAD